MLGFLNPFLYYTVLLKAYSILRAQEALTLNYTWAIMLVLLSILILKQKIRPTSIVAIIISFFGVVIIATRGNILGLEFTNTMGIALALSSSVIWAIYWIYNIKDKRDEVAKLFTNFLFGSLFAFVLLVSSSRLVSPNMNGLIGAVYIGLFEMGITFMLWLKALKYSETTAKVGNLIYISPFLSLLIINIVIGERILISTIIGLFLIVMGIVIQQYRGAKTS